MEEEYWEFVSTGCEKCDAFAGRYAEDPGKPHPYCNCSVNHVIVLEECNYEQGYEVWQFLNEYKEYTGVPGQFPNSEYIIYHREWEVYHVELWICCEIHNGVTAKCRDDVRESYYHVVTTREVLETLV